jgi:glycosyltransferase involved in cell wall biosynthesis
MPLKIGMVTGEFPPMEGGVGAFTEELARALAEQGHDLHIITSREARPEAKGRSLWDAREPHDIGYGLLHPDVRRWRWSSLSAIANVAVRYDLDIVNVQFQAAAFDMTFPAMNFLPWRLRGLAKSVVTFHDMRVPYLFPKAGRLRSWTLERLARSADGIIVTNSDDYESLRIKKIEEDRIRQIPIGSNIASGQPDSDQIVSARKDLGVVPDDCLLGYFGFLNDSKGADILVRALSGLDSRIHLVFIGGRTGSSDPDNNEAFLTRLELLIAKLGLEQRVHWTGFLPASEVSAYLRAADIMVLPYRDGVSLRRGTLMAVLAHGRPLVTTLPAMPAPELMHGENVWLTPVDDVQRLADAIRALAADPELRMRLGQGAQLLSNDFTWDGIARRTADYFRELIGTP